MGIFKSFNPYPPLLAALSKKDDGSCRIPPAEHPEMKERLEENRHAFLKKIGVVPSIVVAAELKHGNSVYRATENDRGRIIPKTDALITNASDVFLSVTVADCLPIFIFDPQKNAVGLIHAGWRGLANNIIGATILAMNHEFGCDPSDVLIGIGPYIGPCHFEVQNDVLQKFAAFPDASLKKGGKIFLDLGAIARHELKIAGVSRTHIDSSNSCTFDLSEEYFSYRRDKPEILETMMAVMGIGAKIV
jgi:YfiH family protein